MKRFLWAMVMMGLGGMGWGATPFDVAVPGITPDDPLIVQGDYTAPTSSGAPVLVLLHGLGSTRGEWAPLVRKTESRGWGVLTYDLRGHGRSRGTMSGGTINYEDPQYGRTESFWKTFPGDLEKVVAALEKKAGVPANQIVLGGASLGANTVLDASTRIKGLRALVLLSPGLNYAGISTEAPMGNLDIPTLMIAAQPDLYAYTSCERLVSLAPAKKVTWKPLERATPQGAHGVQLFDGKLEDQILDWIPKR